MSSVPKDIITLTTFYKVLLKLQLKWPSLPHTNHLDKSGLLTPKARQLLRKDELLHQTSTFLSATVLHRLPVCLYVIGPVFSAYKTPGSLSPVVESLEESSVKSENTFCSSSRYSSSAFNPPQGLSPFWTAALKAPLPLFPSLITTKNWHIQLLLLFKNTF